MIKALIKTYGRLLFAALLLLPSACAREEVLVPNDPKAPGIYIQANLFGASTATKAKDENNGSIHRGDEVNANETYRENVMEGMDVFFHEVGQPETTPWFLEYHFSGTIVSGNNYFLASNWSELGVDPYKDYDVYVCINNPHTHECAITGADDVPDNLAELKALSTHGYITDSNAIPETEYFIFPPGTDYYGTPKGGDKRFLMDGKAEAWHIDRSTSRQVISVDVRRAAAKVIVNIEFDDTEDTMDLVSEDKTKMMVGGVEVDYDPAGTPDKGSFVDYLDYIGRMPSPAPRWKYVNYGLETADIADGTYTVDLDNFTDQSISATHSLQTAPWFNSLSQLTAQPDYRLEKFRIVSYTDPFSWKGENGKAPFNLFSITYQHYTDNGDGTFALNPDRDDWLLNYYRFPVCNEAETDSKLERDNIYIINVRITSLGSSESELELADEQVMIEYHVVPWNETETTQEATTISAADTKYLTVTPRTYTLKGDDTQSVNFQWFASVSTDDGRFVDIDLSSVRISYVNYQGNTVYIENNPTKTPASPDGTQDITITSTAPDNGEVTTVKLTPGGLISVTSDALESRAVKKIEFTVRLRDPNGIELTENITVYHYPLDNIQSFSGSWSSRWSLGSTTQTVREYSFNPTADGWDSYDGYTDNVVCTVDEYNSAEAAHRSSGLEYVTVTATRNEFLANVTTNDDRAAANSEANAVNRYWGEDPTYIARAYSNPGTATTASSWDYWNRYSENGTYYSNRFYEWKYSSYFKQEQQMVYRARLYYRDIETQVASTGSWVDWDRDNGQTYTAADVKYTEGNSFIAKKYNESDGKIYAINVTRSTSGGSYRYAYAIATSQEARGYNTYNEDSGYSANRNSAFTSLSNNQMYVIQVTSTSDKYVLGRPVLDANNLSSDKVVSPAFMIASQLGATVQFTTSAAASAHCTTYMEVGTDGTRYTGWRLPTADEIDFIIEYQQTTHPAYNKTLAPVLTGYGYWALHGEQKYTSYTSGGEQRVRCVRDLTLEDLERLNSH